MSKCDAGLAWRNPAGQDLILACQEDEHLPGEAVVTPADIRAAMETHQAVHSNGVTLVTWVEGDRRNFHGEFPGWCSLTKGCVLPAGHRMDGSGCAT